MSFGSIDFWCVFVWEVLRLSVVGLAVFHSKVFNVVIHGEANRALGVNGVVVPLKTNSGVKVSLSVISEFILFGESLLEVYGMSFANVINTKVVNDQAKHDWSPSVSPEPRCEGALVVVVNLEALL